MSGVIADAQWQMVPTLWHGLRASPFICYSQMLLLLLLLLQD
jgi:hypothetical protein